MNPVGVQHVMEYANRRYSVEQVIPVVLHYCCHGNALAVASAMDLVMLVVEVVIPGFADKGKAECNVEFAEDMKVGIGVGSDSVVVCIVAVEEDEVVVVVDDDDYELVSIVVVVDINEVHDHYYHEFLLSYSQLDASNHLVLLALVYHRILV